MYGKALMRFGGADTSVGGALDLTGGSTYTVALVQSSYNLSADVLANQEYVHQGTIYDVASNEVSTSLGYQRTNLAMPRLSFIAGTPGDISNKASFSDTSGAPTFFINFTGVFRYAVLFQNSGVDAASPLVMVVDFEQEFTVSAANFVIAWDLAGIFQFKAVATTALPTTSGAPGTTFPITLPISIGS
jgi:hypothetical protein